MLDFRGFVAQPLRETARIPRENQAAQPLQQDSVACEDVHRSPSENLRFDTGQGTGRDRTRYARNLKLASATKKNTAPEQT